MKLQLLASLLAIGLLSAVLAGCQGNAALSALNAITPNSGYTLLSDYRYGPSSRQRMDIYRPDSVTDQSRIVVFVYGGAWRKGIKDDYAFVAHALASKGHWLVVPDYRLYPGNRYPDFVQDVVLAIKELPAALDGQINVQGDVLPITLMGHSSGAHTASLIAADAAWLADSPVSVEMLIGLSGPYDLPLEHPEVTSVFDIVANSDEALPIKHISDKHPRTLLVHGTGDRRVLPMHTEHYASALQEQGIAVDVVWLEDSGHAAPLTGLARLLPDNGTLQAVLDALGG